MDTYKERPFMPVVQRDPDSFGPEGTTSLACPNCGIGANLNPTGATAQVTTTKGRYPSNGGHAFAFLCHACGQQSLLFLVSHKGFLLGQWAPIPPADDPEVLALEAENELRAVMDAWPTLTANGLEPEGCREPGNKWRFSLGASFEQDRADLLSPQSVENFRRVREWLAKRTKRKTFNRSWTSYGWKHVAEEELRAAGLYGYSTNGTFIAAAIAEGFQIKPTWFCTNVLINIGVARPNKLKQRP